MIVDVRVMTIGGMVTFSVDDDQHLLRVIDYLDNALSGSREPVLRFGASPFICAFKASSILAYSIHKADDKMRQSWFELVQAMNAEMKRGDEWREP